MAAANKKKFGRKIKVDQIVSLALDLLTEEHIAVVQDQSLTNEDRKESLRQRHIEQCGPISKDDFLGLLLSPEFQRFLSEQSSTGTGSTSQRESVTHAG